MCEATIENAGTLKKIAQVDWNKDTKMASLIYDSTKTNQTEILKRIALAGYDSDLFLAPDEVYAQLPDCCHYDRVNKTALVQNEKSEIDSTQNSSTTAEMEQDVNELTRVFDNYFSLKDALVKSNHQSASTGATTLLSTVNTVKMEKLSADEHSVWMKVVGKLKTDTEKIASASSIEKQRDVFMNLSVNIYDLIKVSQQEKPVYYQHCPMYNDGKGANWVSKESAIENPYYGSQMLNCGKTIETIN